jgi:hypothetical protein
MINCKNKIVLSHIFVVIFSIVQALMEMEINLSTFIYFINKHEDRYYGPMCTLHFLDGDHFFVIFGLFIIVSYTY